LWEEHRNRQSPYTLRNKHQNNTHRGSFKNNNKRHHSFPTVNAADNVPRNSDDASSRTDDATAPPTALAANTQQLTMKRRNNGGLAFATTHQANVVTQHIPKHSTQANTATINENNRERTTCISDWLIDSGCTAHMSTCLEDFIEPLQPYETLVEVANGGVTHVSHQGKTKVYIRDIFRRNHSVIAILNNALYVPGLTRRLISVVEWNFCGGHISFLQDRIRLEVFHEDGNLATSIDVAPLYGVTGQLFFIPSSINHHQQQSKQTNESFPVPTTSPTRTPIDFLQTKR
jgi:hypothetical protein